MSLEGWGMPRSERGRMNETNRWLTRAIVAGCALSLVAQHAEAQDVPPPPPASAPQVVVVAPAAPQPQPQPQVVYVQQQAPQYGQAVYMQPSYGGAPPPEAPRHHHANLGPIIGGAVMLGAGWVLNIVGSLFAGVHVDLFGGGGGPDEQWQTFRFTGLIPVLGPWIQLGVQPTSFSQDGWGTWLIIDGLLQAAGLTLLIVGATMSSGDEEATADGDGGVQLALLPSVSPGQVGLTLVGRF
jgi:hypothetical protein